jgi:hypothetical protein
MNERNKDELHHGEYIILWHWQASINASATITHHASATATSRPLPPSLPVSNSLSLSDIGENDDQLCLRWL